MSLFIVLKWGKTRGILMAFENEDKNTHNILLLNGQNSGITDCCLCVYFRMRNCISFIHSTSMIIILIIMFQGIYFSARCINISISSGCHMQPSLRYVLKPMIHRLTAIFFSNKALCYIDDEDSWQNKQSQDTHTHTQNVKGHHPKSRTNYKKKITVH